MSDRKSVLILCTGNSARSQMAEGFLRHVGGITFDIEGAGVSPSQIRPEAIEVMDEIGILLTGHYSKSGDEFVGQEFDYIITVCENAKESCPVFPGNAERIHWGFDDPAAIEGTHKEKIESFRRVRDEITDKLINFSESNSYPAI